MVDEVVVLDIGCVPEAAVSGAMLLQSEERSFLTFVAMREGEGDLMEDAGTAIVEFECCHVTRFGYPNDEAPPGHPLYAKGLRSYGVYEVLESSWVETNRRQNLVSFPDAKEGSGKKTRHFVFTFHDSTLEALAVDLAVTVSTEPYTEIYRKLSARLLSW